MNTFPGDAEVVDFEMEKFYSGFCATFSGVNTSAIPARSIFSFRLEDWIIFGVITLNSIQGPQFHMEGEHLLADETLGHGLRVILGRMELLLPFSFISFLSLSSSQKRKKKRSKEKREKARGWHQVTAPMNEGLCFAW